MTGFAPDYRKEDVDCPHCGSSGWDYFLTGEDDLTGIKGEFAYVKCRSCRLVYQNPRLTMDEVKRFYTDSYIAHRKTGGFGLLTPLYNWAMEKHDREKVRLIKPYVSLNSYSSVLDVGCAVGTFLLMLRKVYGCGRITGVDFKDMSYYPGFNEIDFCQGTFHEQQLSPDSYDLITMWHFLEHDYYPRESLQKAREFLKRKGVLVIEVPRLDSVTYKLFKSRWPGVQAPQHTALYSKDSLLNMVSDEGMAVVDYLPYGAFPAYFYVFSGIAFKVLKGKGMDPHRIVIPYFLGQLLLAPIMAFHKHLNLSMQTVILKKM